MKIVLLFICTLLHFAVDGICAAALANLAADMTIGEAAYYFQIYTLGAFGTQWFAGLLLDRYKKRLPAAGVLALALLLIGSFGLNDLCMRALFLGLGNSIFHVLAGIAVLNRYGGFTAPGVFVASGAIGLALGLQQIVPLACMALLCTVSGLSLAYLLRNNLRPYYAAIAKVKLDKTTVALGVSVLSACVVLRGFSGSVQLDDLPLWLPCIYAAGKALGGIFCDRFGYMRTILALLVVEFLALQFAGIAPMLGFVLLCNMTMPLTLRLLHYYLPQYAGFVFGLAAFCLLPGWAFKYYYISLPVMTALQFILLFVGGYLLFSIKPAPERSGE